MHTVFPARTTSSSSRVFNVTFALVCSLVCIIFCFAFTHIFERVIISNGTFYVVSFAFLFVFSDSPFVNSHSYFSNFGFFSILIFYRFSISLTSKNFLNIDGCNFSKSARLFFLLFSQSHSFHRI